MAKMNTVLVFLLLILSQMAMAAEIRSKTSELSKKLLGHTSKLNMKVADSTCNCRSCPNGWTFHGGSCFLIVDTPTQKWEDAREHCKNLGADLAIVRSAADNEFIFDLIDKQQTVTQYGAWLGFKRYPDNNLYWLDGSPVGGKYMYKAWSAGNPDNQGGHEDCGHMLGTIHDPGKWNDLGCDVSTWAGYNAPVILCQKAIS